MRITLLVLRMLVRVLGVIQIVLGVLFWTGNTLTLVPVHMLAGLLIVLVLWVLAALALWTRAAVGLGALALLWGLVVVALGVTQTGLVPGDLHWLVQVAHLLVGLAALGLAERLSRRIATRGGPSPALTRGVALAG